MSATDELRRMLDERGVEYEGGERSLRWRDRYGVMMQAFPLANGELGMDVWSCTPEQAIAATLGVTDAKPTQAESSGTCHDVWDDVLREMLDAWGELPSNATNEAIIAEYAAKLRLAEEDA